MGRLKNFEKIEWKPFSNRIGNISVRNYWTDENAKKKTLNSHLDHPRYSFFEIVKWSSNGYYGKLEEYLENGWEISHGGEKLEKDRIGIDLSLFTRNPETCYTLASWTNMDHDECSPDLRFVGSRPMDLFEEEQATFMELTGESQIYIEAILRNHDSSETNY
jgi:hypothetical protein